MTIVSVDFTSSRYGDFSFLIGNNEGGF